MPASADLLKELRIDRSAPPPAPSSRKRLALAAVGVGVLAVSIGAWVAFGRQQPLAVQTADVVALGNGGSASATVLDATGYVVARRMATVSAKITGKVREVLIEEGQHVEAGQVLATLDPVDADAERELASSQVSAARSAVGGVQARLKEAEANVVRLDGLVKQQLISKAQHDQAVAERDALRAELLTTQRNAHVASDRLRIADQGVDNTVVRAPFAGVITAKAAQPGEIVSPMSAGGGFTRTGIGTIVDMDSLEVEVEVGEAFIGRVKPKMPVEATLDAYPDWKIPGEVIAIIPAADRGKATVKVRVAIKVKDPRIVPDMGVSVSFLDAEANQQMAKGPTGALVPNDAIVERDGVKVVFVAGGDPMVAEQRTLKLGRAMANGQQVLGGVSAGETVVLDPPATLQDGARVRVATPENTTEE
ncbi:efflux RND transporter periplasmic adaptor subunit [Lysobacter sp. A6]|uniref:Efflux RND transporter periplasmic adaptor subunit n=1 Tax=Noviluteimonas lactosilytica TaxID=2888523 RepID=A0ABS8JGX5_9GAMM|nr:efflux RND transporter periplasmic adaptor subunit [Lysobacter lactosilyticus]MCC8362856.1 efflux RND transporter periplasmic adaptor subunit [Lysobacter lactosilyticus]